ncbi:MAG TPA: hypothetical protein VMI11_15650 [Actinomycetes bacterium]|nr:hypothetical protein [Actinomycetes bacterium]
MPRQRVWPTWAPASPGPLSDDGQTLFAMGMKDPEGNEFDIN